MTHLLQASGLSKSFGGVWALKELSLHQDPGETLGMIGPNGSGKTTFINAVTGHLAADRGEVLLDGKAIRGKSAHAIALDGLVRTYQAVRVYAQLPVWENLRIAGLPHYRRLGRSHPLDGSEKLLAKLQLENRKEAAAGSLTLFEQRRLELAMRLISRPKLLMLDEPVGGLNPGEIREMIQVLKGLRSECSLFVIEHTMKVIMELADRVVVLVSGEMIANGAPAAILQDANVIRQYLGSIRVTSR
ncbi:MAG TPA: ATP-binding cassette domain-containing protein [Syntrophales bacterium]|nr:ATP-binding cassette domain-containing protein [Syntrophales bacterium]